MFILSLINVVLFPHSLLSQFNHQYGPLIIKAIPQSSIRSLNLQYVRSIPCKLFTLYPFIHHYIPLFVTIFPYSSLYSFILHYIPFFITLLLHSSLYSFFKTLLLHSSLYSLIHHSIYIYIYIYIYIH